MLTYAVDVLFVLLVALATALPTGHLAAGEPAPVGGEEGEPTPAPQPEEQK